MSSKALENIKKRELYRGPADAKLDQVTLKLMISNSQINQNFNLEKFISEFLKLSSEYKEQGLPVKTRNQTALRDFTTDLDQLITRYDEAFTKNPDQFPNDLKFTIAHFSILRAFRGYVWRLIPTAADSKAVQSALITQVKFTINSISAFISSGNSDLIVAYLTEPLIENGIFPSAPERKGKPLMQFQSTIPGRGSEVMVALDFRNYILPTLMKAAKRIEAISMGPDLKKDFVFDLALIYGVEAFESGLGKKTRYLRFGDVEKQLVLSQLYGSIGSLLMQLSYTWEDGVKLANTAIGIIGMDPILGVINPNGITTAEVMSNMRRQRLRWGVLQPNFVSNVVANQKKPGYELAYDYFKISADRFLASYSALQNRDKDSSYIVWNIIAPMNPMLQQITDDFIAQLTRFRDGKDLEFISRVTGEVVVISPSQFFTKPPGDLKRAFSIEEDRNLPSKIKKYQGVPEYRNYYQGRALKWDTDFYSHLFPQLKGCTQAKQCQSLLKNQTKILAESWSGFPFNVFLLPTLQ
ncbi:MAG: hypothetical protein ACK5V3_09625 [Bdellovibrionales bacterium]